MQWTGEAARANANLRTSEQVKKIKIPMQIYSAENLIPIVDNEGHKTFCRRAQTGLCQNLFGSWLTTRNSIGKKIPSRFSSLKKHMGIF